MSGWGKGKAHISGNEGGIAGVKVSLPIGKEKSDKPLICNERALTAQLKGKTAEDVLKVLGVPAVKKPCKECDANLEYWWYNILKVGIFVYLKDGKVYNISVMTESRRSKEL